MRKGISSGNRTVLWSPWILGSMMQPQMVILTMLRWERRPQRCRYQSRATWMQWASYSGRDYPRVRLCLGCEVYPNCHSPRSQRGVVYGQATPLKATETVLMSLVLSRVQSRFVRGSFWQVEEATLVCPTGLWWAWWASKTISTSSRS